MNRVKLNEKGFSIIELIITLVLLAIVVSVSFPLFGFLNQSTTKQLNEYSQRSDVLTATQLITQDVHYAKSITNLNSASVEILDADDVLIRYRMDNTSGTLCLLRERDGKKQYFKEISKAEFSLENADLLAVNLVADDAENRFKAAKWGNTVAVIPPETGFPGEGIGIFSNQLFLGDTTINGRNETMYLNTGLDCSTEIRLYTNLYFNGDVTLSGLSILGFANKKNIIVVNGDVSLSGIVDIDADVYIFGNFTSSADLTMQGNIYVQGNVTMSGTLKHAGNGQIQYEGTLTKTANISESSFVKKAEIEMVEFPEYSMPTLRPSEWYIAKGYKATTILNDNVKVFDSFNSNYTATLSRDVNNVIIVSKGNITINNYNSSNDMSGILFAPNGTVTLNGDTSFFTGVIISKTIDLTDTGQYTIKSISEYISNPDDYPFGGIE